MKVIASLVAVLLIATVTLFAASATKKLIDQRFTTSGTYLWNTADYPSALSIDMTFVTGAYNNTFTFGYTRDGVYHEMLRQTATNMHTLIWYVPSRYFWKTGDTLTWSNTVAQPATIAINADFQF
jgi:hypothetical protein